MKELANYFQNKKVSSVLDIGCGSGDFIKVLASVFTEETKITGIDPFEEALTEARQKFPSEKIEFLQMGGEQIAFPDNCFDVVSISFALHHLADVSKTLSEMIRVVKPDGWMIINEIVSEVQNEAQENQKMLHHLKSFTDRLNGIPHRKTYSTAEVLEIIASKPTCNINYFTNKV
jgi:ubiquinone/menaquinone biosynthesis C-methylase UbiE